MNAGFSSLTALKTQLLNTDLRPSTDYDQLVLAIGLGVAGLIEGHCNRSFARALGDTLFVAGGGRVIALPRYPVESLDALDTRATLTADWQDALDAVDDWSADSGLVSLSRTLAGKVRVTWTGGYWWSTAEGDPASLVIGALRRYGQVAIPAGAQEVAVAWPALPVAPAGVTALVIKPASGADDLVVTGLVGAPVVDGCRVRLSAPAPDATYLLSYEATGDLLSPAGDAGTLPEGATALPGDLQAAWFLQCEEVWRRRDALGLTPAFVAAELRPPMLTAIELLPLVRDMLARHVRYS